jgi:hypothetical protein
MPQVSLYLDQEALDLARRNARISNISLSRYVSRALIEQGECNWPEGYWNLFGSLLDNSFELADDTPFDQFPSKVEF